MLQLFKSITSSRFCWFLLLSAGVALEVCGWYFQYKLNLQPCVNCVYERAFILGFILAGFLGAVAANFFVIRLISSLIFAASSAGGLYISFLHFIAYNKISFGTFGEAKCAITTNFPSYLPLDQWAGFLFKAYGMCDEKLDWSLFTLSMPTWILIMFSVATLVSLFMLVGDFIPKKSANFDKLYK